MSLAAGLMRERIAFYSFTETVSSEAQPVKSAPVTVATVWARVSSLNGREFEAMKAISAEAAWKFTVNFRTDITVLMKIFWRNATWNIHDIQPDEDKFYMAIFASKVQ